ncbi:flagellar biosynthesis anti-sigma factor FlgM [Desulfosporosinus sp. Sb-LF]|uniref:flagellar biosynthesis anti-sigma factor FlgM n=1 Tax=Desulfosporosinus sp. Sb-LF TaxID=2560027 RepID=UPI00107F86F3|nr:flagellar biosynthesis anti-sigma factor FlgM [Desulfosporosinus sp. Sb-LF]TGE32587.1 flagellar biosynthesis anti-sigma factor FlgM [Desulfosporosinus sp. Sb-LF]
MKVEGPSLPPVGGVKATSRINQISKKTMPSEGDNVAVSDKAQVYQALIQKAKELPSIREDRVRALSEQIERGEFKVNGQKIAETIVSPEF